MADEWPLQELLDAVKAEREDRAARMPDTVAALHVLRDAHHRLTELGWRSAAYAPMGVDLLVIEAGSTSEHRAKRDKVSFWIYNHGDMWPSNPILFREVTNG